MMLLRFLVLALMVSGCGLARHPITVPPLAVTFGVFDLSENRAMDVQQIAFDELLPPTADRVSGGGVGRGVSLPNSPFERQRLIFGTAGAVILPGAPGIGFSLCRDESGRYIIDACLHVHHTQDFIWVQGGPRNETEALRQGWRATGRSYYKHGHTVVLEPRVGESGVFLLPDKSDPKYAVCYVVIGKPPPSKQLK